MRIYKLILYSSLFFCFFLPITSITGEGLKINLNENNTSILSSGAYYSNITTDKIIYSCFENVIANFEYVSFKEDTSLTFRYEISDSISVDGEIYHSSNPRPSNDIVSENYTFNLLNYDMNIPDEGRIYYILLVLCINGERTMICEYKSIEIYKETLDIFSDKNNTMINYGDIININLEFFSAEDYSHKLVDSQLYYQIYNDNEIIGNCVFLTTNSTGNTILNFDTNNYDEIGILKINIVCFNATHFVTNSFNLTLIVYPYVINMDSYQPSIVNLKVSNYKQEYILQNFKINITHNSSIIYNSKIIPMIKYEDKIHILEDLFNGTYQITLFLDNYARNIYAEIYIEPDLFYYEPLLYLINITKRNLNFNLFFTKSLIQSNNMDNTQITFEIKDELTNYPVDNLEDELNLEFYFNDKWNSIEIKPIFGNQFYSFILNDSLINDLNLITNKSINLRILFKGNEIYSIKNSSSFLIISNNEFPEDFSDPNLFIINIIRGSYLVGIIITISILPITINYIYVHKIKKKFLITECKF